MAVCRVGRFARGPVRTRRSSISWASRTALTARRKRSTAAAGAERGGGVDLRNGVRTSGPLAGSSGRPPPGGAPPRPRPVTRWPTGPSLASFDIWLGLQTLGWSNVHWGVVPKPDARGPDDPVSSARQPRGRHVQCTWESDRGVEGGTLDRSGRVGRGGGRSCVPRGQAPRWARVWSRRETVLGWSRGQRTRLWGTGGT